MDKVVVQSFVSLLLVGDRLGCSKMVKQYVQESFSIKEVYEKLIKSALYEIGILWEQNKISVADEHLATSISEAILNELYTDVVSEYRENKQVVLACVDGETHQVGLKMVADVFEMNGWDAKYLGSSVPASELIKIIDKFQPEIVGISFSIYFHFDTLKKMVYSIRQDFPNKKILIGGQGFLHGGIEELVGKDANIVYCPTLDSLDEYIKSL